MLKYWWLILALMVLGYGFWVSAHFSAVAAGVAIFLFGMMFLGEGFQAFTGGGLEKILRWFTSNTFKSLSFGFAATTVMQSSSLITIITISFLSAGLIDLVAGLGIAFGASIGTTTGAWLFAGFGMKVNISAFAMPMLVFGLVLKFQKSKSLKGLGDILAGIGFVFLGIHFMKEGFEAVQESIDLTQYAVSGFKGVLLYTAIGIVATVVMQSSHATLLLTIAALSTSQVAYDNALAMTIGANVGTTITAILGAINANVAGKRLAGGHLIFKTFTGVIAILFIGQFRWAVDFLSDIVGIAPDDWTLKLALFYTLFSIVGVVLLVPFIGLMVRFLTKRIGEKTAEERIEEQILQPLYLNEAALHLPDTALEVLEKETAHLSDNAFEILAHGLNLHRTDIRSDRGLDDVVATSSKIMDIDVEKKYYKGIKTIYNAIIEYAIRAEAKHQLTDSQASEFYNIRIICRNVAQVVKLIYALRRNMVKYITSDNEHIQQEYNTLRKNIVTTLRRLFAIEAMEDKATILLTFEEIKADLAAQDVTANGTVDRLVREQAITSEMATSLMNDSAHAIEIGELLLEMGKRTRIVEETDPKAVSDEMLLEEGDFSGTPAA